MGEFAGAALASAEEQVRSRAGRTRGAARLARADVSGAERPPAAPAVPAGGAVVHALAEAVALVGDLPGEPSSRPVRLWLEFVSRPTGRNWYRAHNASIVSAYLEHRDLAGAESPPERFFMDVALVRVLYAHALVGAPRLALGRFAPLGRVLGDPRLGMAGVFLSLRRVLPNRYPLALDVERYIADEQRLGRLLDYAVIVPRLQRLYEWSGVELSEPRLLELVRDGNPIYAWPFEERHVWRSKDMPFVARVLERATRAT
jgi:hypothetical protein